MVKFFNIRQEKEIGLLNELNTKGLSGLFNYFKTVNWFVLINMLLIFIWNLVLITGSVYFLFIKNIDPKFRLIFIIIIIYLCFFSGAVACARLKTAVFPLLIITLPYLFEKCRDIYTSFK
ncbi:MAG: hypothetical protein HY738_10450 [Bacteroidia bacterium]|nr:hypothetical protein [Bacteroidia bacterium]